VQARSLRLLLRRTLGHLPRSVMVVLSPLFHRIPQRERWPPFLLLHSLSLLVLLLPLPMPGMAGRIPLTLQVGWLALQRAVISIHGSEMPPPLHPFVVERLHERFVSQCLPQPLLAAEHSATLPSFGDSAASSSCTLYWTTSWVTIVRTMRLLLHFVAFSLYDVQTLQLTFFFISQSLTYLFGLSLDVIDLVAIGSGRLRHSRSLSSFFHLSSYFCMPLVLMLQP